MAVVVVSEPIAAAGLDRLAAAGHEVRVELDLARLPDVIGSADALVIRSETRVTDELLALAPRLVVVGRAGIGLDNVDIAAATRRGVMVVNAPQSNIVSAAEHTMALLLAQARNIPQAHAALVAGRWERSRWEGVELADKTLAIIGLGRIGKLVADRARAFGMRLVAHDPYVSADRARQIGVELMSLEEAVEAADFLTVHLPRTKETTGLIGRELLARAKPTLRVVNVARGGIVDEEALAGCVRDGTIAGAAVDVFDREPTTDSPLLGLDGVVVTPHLGASTREAQDKAGETVAEMVVLALAGEFVPFAVNIDAAEANESLRPFLPLAERLGRLFASLVGASPAAVEVSAEGDLAGHDTRIVVLAAMKGYFQAISDEPVTFVNVPQLAAEHGVEVRELRSAHSPDYVNLIGVRGGGHAIAGTVVGRRAEQRIMLIDGHRFDVPPSEHMLMVNNDDRPGVIGTVGTLLGAAGVNIDDMDVGRTEDPGSAVMLIATAAVVDDEVVERLRAAPGITSVVRLAG